MLRSSSATGSWRSSAIVLTLVTWLAARRVDGLPRWVRNVALATSLGTVAQIPLGGITVLLGPQPDRRDVALPARALVLAGASSSRSRRGVTRAALAPPAGPRWLRAVAAVGVAACAVLVVTGTVATASGPHSGGQDIPRLGLGVTDTVYVHVRATAVFGIGFLVVGVFLWRLRRELPGIAAAGAVLLGAAARPDGGRRDPVPERAAVVARRRSTSRWRRRSGRSRSAIAYSLCRPPRAPLGERRRPGEPAS